MPHHIYETEGFVLALRASGEADMMAYMYTRDFGMLKLFAKSMRLTKSKLRGHLELFSRARIRFVVGKELYRLTDAGALSCATRLSRDPYRFQVAGMVSRFFRELVVESEADEHAWELLSKSFQKINDSDFSKEQALSFLYQFQLRAFACLGYLPEERPPVAERMLIDHALPGGISLVPRERRELDAFLQRIYGYAASARVYTTVGGGSLYEVPKFRIQRII